MYRSSVAFHVLPCVVGCLPGMESSLYLHSATNKGKKITKHGISVAH